MTLSFPLVAAFAATLALTPAVRAWARATGRIARPSSDRWHERPTALMGGIAMYLGFVAGGAAVLVPALEAGGGAGLADGSLRIVLGLAAAASVMFATGAADDVLHMRPTTKLVLQAVAGAILVTFGVRLAITPWDVANAVLTLFWCIALTNAVNLLDNMDGAAAGVAGVGFATLAALFLLEGEWALGGVAAALAGSTAGFLVYNFRPASIFMGDSGSLFLGGLLAGLSAAYSGGGGGGPVAAAAVPLLVAAVPILDTALVTITRTRAGYSVTQGGRDHVSHRLVGMGFSERQAALLLYGLAGLGGVLAVGVHRDGGAHAAWWVTLFAVALVVLGSYLSRLYVYPPEGARPAGVVRILLEELLVKRRLLEVVFDVVVFTAAYAGAYLLRYEAALPPVQSALLSGSVALVVASKLVAFGGLGVYRGVWHRIGMADAHRLVWATATGTLLATAAMVFVYREGEFSRSVLVLDGILTLLFAFGVRVSFRSLEHVRARLRGRGRPVVIYGAGIGGEVAVREILSNPELDLTPVGFVDDDVQKHGCVIHGLPVLGSGADLPGIIRERRIEHLVLSTRKIAHEQLELAVESCRFAGVAVRRLRIVLTDLADEAALAAPVVEHPGPVSASEGAVRRRPSPLVARLPGTPV